LPDYTVKFPLEFSNESNGFETIDEEKLKELVFFNLKNIILTNPGERIFNPIFGVGIKRYLFEQENVRLDEIEYRIRNQIRLFASFVNVKDLQLNMENNALQIILKFEIKKPRISDVLILDIEI
jgi:phage baseplate assembly protein W